MHLTLITENYLNIGQKNFFQGHAFTIPAYWYSLVNSTFVLSLAGYRTSDLRVYLLTLTFATSGKVKALRFRSLI